MTKADFDMLLDRAVSGDVQSMRTMAMICFKMVEGATNNGDAESANMYMGLGDGWKLASENGLKNAEQVKALTITAFSNCF